MESLVTTPAEQVVSQIKGIDTLYSFSRPDGALLVVVFKVGVSREQAIVDLNNQLDSNRDWLPQGLGVGQPLVKPRGIDDVPIVSLTLWSKEWQKQLGAAELTRVPTSWRPNSSDCPVPAISTVWGPACRAAGDAGSGGTQRPWHQLERAEPATCGRQSGGHDTGHRAR